MHMTQFNSDATSLRAKVNKTSFELIPLAPQRLRKCLHVLGCSLLLHAGYPHSSLRADLLSAEKFVAFRFAKAPAV